MQLIPEARAGMGRYVAFCNDRHPRSSLERKTPDQVHFDQPQLIPLGGNAENHFAKAPKLFKQTEASHLISQSGACFGSLARYFTEGLDELIHCRGLVVVVCGPT